MYCIHCVGIYIYCYLYMCNATLYLFNINIFNTNIYASILPPLHYHYHHHYRSIKTSSNNSLQSSRQPIPSITRSVAATRRPCDKLIESRGWRRRSRSIRRWQDILPRRARGGFISVFYIEGLVLIVYMCM